MIIGAIGAGISAALIWIGLRVPFDAGEALVWRIVAPVILIPLGLAAGVGTMFLLDEAGLL